MFRGVLALVAVTAGCRSRTPTYYDDVAPILAQRCAECHRPGGVAPIPLLDSYENVKMYAEPMRVAVQTRRMPPFAADDTGECGTWEDARWLTTGEIATIAAWSQGDMPEGRPGAKPSPEKRPAPFRADATVDTGGVYRPGLGAGGSRCFVADPRLDRDRLLSAIRVVSSDARAVAQVTLFALDSAEAEAEAMALDGREAGPGWSCYGGTRTRDARLVASWTWPTPILRMPPGTGVRLGAGRKLVMQIHYDVSLTGSDFQAGTRIDLELAEGVREARLVPLRASGALEPNQRYVAVENSQIAEGPMRVVGVAPRMHVRGQTMRLSVEWTAESTCLAAFDHWHDNSQQLFRSLKPESIRAGEKLQISCAYNTLGRVAPVQLGEAAEQEECTAWLLVTD
jgi:hypothetical protein